jgi:hypothetical protein
MCWPVTSSAASLLQALPRSRPMSLRSISEELLLLLLLLMLMLIDRARRQRT